MRGEWDVQSRLTVEYNGGLSCRSANVFTVVHLRKELALVNEQLQERDNDSLALGTRNLSSPSSITTDQCALSLNTYRWFLVLRIALYARFPQHA